MAGLLYDLPPYHARAVLDGLDFVGLGRELAKRVEKLRATVAGQLDGLDVEEVEEVRRAMESLRAPTEWDPADEPLSPSSLQLVE